MVAQRSRRAFLITLSLSLASCVSTSSRERMDALRKIRKVGVIAAVADVLHRTYTTGQVVGTEFEQLDIRGWRVDDEYELQMQHALSALAQFEVVRLPRSGLSALYELSVPSEGRKPSWDRLRDTIINAARVHELDAIVLLIKRDSEDFLGGTPQHLRGAGLYASAIAGSPRLSVLHLFASIALLDGHTGELIAIRFLSRIQEGWPGTLARSAPMLVVPADFSRNSLEQMGDARATDVRRQLVALPAQAWVPTLRALLYSDVS